MGWPRLVRQRESDTETTNVRRDRERERERERQTHRQTDRQAEERASIRAVAGRTTIRV